MIDLLINCLMLQLFSTADMQLYSGDHEAWASKERRHALGLCDFHNSETKERQEEAAPSSSVLLNICSDTSDAQSNMFTDSIFVFVWTFCCCC